MTIVVRCECGRQFEAGRRLAGGFTNCPGCGSATEVPGLRDPLWRLVQIAGVTAAALAGIAGYTFGGPLAAAVAIAVAAAALWIGSRSL